MPRFPLSERRGGGFGGEQGRGPPNQEPAGQGGGVRVEGEVSIFFCRPERGKNKIKQRLDPTGNTAVGK